MTSGVPQGSVLGPLLFVIYINDISQGVTSNMSIYADDSKCFDAVSKNTVQESLKKLDEWSKLSAMDFNVAKSCVIHMGKRNPRIQYTVGGEVIREAASERDLGVQVHEDLVFHEQCQIVVNKCRKLTGQIKRAFTNREPELMINIFKTYLLPILDFAVCAWSPWHRKDIDLIESVQRRYTKLIKGFGHLQYEQRLKCLGMPTLEKRRTYLDLVQAFRLHRGYDSLDHSLFTMVQNAHSRNTRQAENLNWTCQVTKQDLRKNFFSQRVVHMWNDLPTNLKKMTSLSEFKTNLSQHIFD